MSEYKVIHYSAMGHGTRQDVVNRAIEGLMLRVNLGIKDGFMPIGGVSVVIDESYFVVASQAVTKKPST